MIEEIDEAAMLQSIYERDNPPKAQAQPVAKVQPVSPPETEKAETPEQPKEENRRKRKTQDYESLFIRESGITARLGKTVYIRKEFHDRILKIIQVVGGNEVSLFSYIDNVLAHHFDNFQEDISQAYRQRVSNDIF
jgi:hypothetical protein